jgi:hypothetical protein
VSQEAVGTLVHQLAVTHTATANIMSELGDNSSMHEPLVDQPRRRK